MKIAYCGYDFFHGCLDTLTSAEHEILEVFTWPADNEYDFNDLILSTAQKIGCRIQFSPMTSDDIDRLASNGCELIVSAAYPYKIPNYEGRIKYGLNVHPSPLPNGRGPWPLPWIILKDLKKSAVSFHKLSQDWDAGDLLYQDWFDVDSRENLETLSAKCQLSAKSKILKILENLDDLWDRASPQTKSDYWNMPEKHDRMISWNMDVSEIDRIVRAFGKFISFAKIENVQFSISDVSTIKQAHNFAPGEVVNRMNRETVVAAKDGLVVLRHMRKTEK